MSSITKRAHNILDIPNTSIQMLIFEYVSAIVSLPIICYAGPNPGGIFLTSRRVLERHMGRASGCGIRC